MADAPPPLGLIAGSGQLPLLVASGARTAGRAVVAVGLRDQFDPALPSLCHRFHTAGIVQIGRWIRLLRREGVHEAIMVGRVAKARMHDPLRLFRQLPDLRAALLWYRRLRHDRRNAALLAAVADELASAGITLIDSTAYIPGHMASPGVMGKVTPSREAEGDMTLGWPLLVQIVELDIGQSIAVRDRDVIAVEAVEGTDALIDRAGALCRAKGWTLLKTAKRAHDMRSDVPTVGVQTIERLAERGGRCLALGAGRVIMVDRPAVLAAADRLGIAVVGVPEVAASDRGTGAPS
ncbi:MAG: UDP-2,3-diacylglucosamine diphosphatase LpxI [Phycisphaeraceae bacterium]|nr:UDP-2,3-diacylglucosamine diphosphatase LpxI [Phycisphaeraceae bacterium]